MKRFMSIAVKSWPWVRILIGVIIVVMGLLMILRGLPAFATIADPDSISVTDISVNRHLLETNDMLVYALYNVAYTSPPTEDIDETFIFRLLDTDGTTELGAIEAYPYYNGGYGKGVIAFYFAAADAPTWGLSYFIKVEGKPTMFATPPSQPFIINAGDYTSETTQADNQTEVADNMIAIAAELESSWTGITLVDSSDIGDIFAAQGETYFRNSVYGIQSMCPELFSTQVHNPDYTERTWNTTQQTTYEARTSGGYFGSQITGFADVFNLDFSMMASIPILIACAAMIYMSVKFVGNANSGLLNCVLIILVGAYMGYVPFGLVAIMSLIMFIHLGMMIANKVPA